MTLDRDLVVRALPAYEIGDEIGRGGWALVLHARHRSLGRDVAVKLLPRAFAADPDVLERFRAEARVVANLDHPHIVPVHDFVEHEGTCLLVMGLMEPHSLWARFVAHGIALDAACGVALASCAALSHAHDRGVLHRDVKPENLLFSRQGVAKLGDFGIAKVLGTSGPALTRTGTAVGTPAYLAPEQARGEALDARTDVYALGVVLYELVTGMLPFGDGRDPMRQLEAKTTEEPRPITDLRPDLHGALATVIMQAIARDRDGRPGSAHELGLALAGAATAAFGRGWLRRSGIAVMGAPELAHATEVPPPDPGGAPPGSAGAVMDPHAQVLPVAATHPRVGSLAPRDAVEGALAWPGPPLAPAAAAVPAGGPPPGITRSRRRHRGGVMVLAGAAVAAGLATTLVVAARLGRVDAGPVIDQVQMTGTGAALHWRDDGRPGGPHLLHTYSATGTEQHELRGSPQALTFAGRPRFCFVVARANGDQRRSAPWCVNGAAESQLITQGGLRAP